MHLGPLIRRYRKEKKLTLKAVAKKAGVSEGFLSQVENNVNSPSVETLMKICSSIGFNAGDLLNQIEKQETLTVIRKQDWSEVDFPRTGFTTRRFFSPEYRRVIDSAILVIEPGKSIPARKGIKDGQELLCILQGSLELVHGESKVKMSKGDSVHFWSAKEQQEIINRNNERAVALWIGTL